MNPQIVVAVANGQIQISSQLDALSCIELLAEAQRILAQNLRQQAQQAQQKKNVLMPDGTPAPPQFLGMNRINGENGTNPG